MNQLLLQASTGTMATYYDVFETPIGWMGVLASPRGLRRTTLPQSSPDRCVSLLEGPVDAAIRPDRFARLRDRLCLHLGGTPVRFDDEPLDLGDASPFLRAAWKACMSIPTGETRTYKWLATQAGRPRASRAAGQAMARNRLPLIVPCHRVVATDGSLRGFGGGATQLDLKRRLLQLEAGHGAPGLPSTFQALHS